MPVAPFMYGCVVFDGPHHAWSGNGPVHAGGGPGKPGKLVYPSSRIIQEWAELVVADPADGWSPATAVIRKVGREKFFACCEWVRGHAYRMEVNFCPIAKSPKAFLELLNTTDTTNVNMCKEWQMEWIRAVEAKASAKAGTMEGRDRDAYVDGIKLRLKVETLRMLELDDVRAHMIDFINEHKIAMLERLPYARAPYARARFPAARGGA